LVILGDGAQKLRLTNQVNQLGLEGEVYLHGFVDNVYPYFKYAKLCVVSSRVEGFPNVLLQMMSQNNKVVSTKCAGGIEDIKGVFIAETDNVGSLETAIKLCLEADTSVNDYIFQQYLKDRSIDNFSLKIENELNS
jgi:glycosyltransferase involved in cell wall biosynthesis